MLRAVCFHLSLLLACSCLGTASAQEWQPLFNDHSFDSWTKQDGSDVDAPAWKVEGGMLHLDRTKGTGGNLLSKEVYGDFELVFEWKLAQGANNGIKYRVNDFNGKVLGIEYQVIDDLNQPSLEPRYRTASLYDIYEPKEHQLFRPEGEFNSSRIVVRNQRIEHWLNGHLVNEAVVGSKEWLERIAKSKFADDIGFGVIPIGHIMITDHNDEAWYRNIFIRRLDYVGSAATMDAFSTTTCTYYPPQQCRRRPRWRRRR